MDRMRKLQAAEYMRQNPTSGEAAMSDLLAFDIPEAKRFESQCILAGYITDFYIPDHKLAIEIDGGNFHDSPRRKRYDAKRTDDLKRELGVTVVRFRSKELFRQPRVVVETIRRLLG
jgi:very-short-patch-repair endonuclease